MPKILLQDQDLYTYAIGLYQFVTGPYETEWGLFSAASLIGAVPIAVVFMLLQNFLVSGLTKGAVKG
jgi:maltose/maltodextrin transport system permease protein